MTHEEKLYKITQDIRAKLPRLMELEEGTIIRLDHEDGTSTLGKVMTVNAGYIYFYNESFSDCVKIIQKEKNVYEIAHDTEIDEKMVVIGKEPMLHDILQWFNIIIEEVKEEGFEKRIYLYDRMKELPGLWDLSKPYLKDQSEELIDFLDKLRQ